MPGFSINGGGGNVPNTIELLTNYRWLITELGPVSSDSLVVARDLVLPESRVEVQEILGGLIWYKFAKNVKWQDVTVVFYDDGKILDGIEQWRELVYTIEDGIKTHTPGSGYKRKCAFELLDGAGDVKKSLSLMNAWPTAVSHGRLSYSDSEIKIVNLILAYDWAEILEQTA